jgi:hypothetical protein
MSQPFGATTSGLTSPRYDIRTGLGSTPFFDRQKIVPTKTNRTSQSHDKILFAATAAAWLILIIGSFVLSAFLSVGVSQ